MKKLFIPALLLFPFLAFAQPGVSFHQSNLPFVGINYEFKNKLRIEARIGTDRYFDEFAFEPVLTYDFIKKPDYEIYGGLGANFTFSGVDNLRGLVIPVGINIFPFTAKQFGFHIELTPIVGENAVLRGSWGIRYRFLKKG